LADGAKRPVSVRGLAGAARQAPSSDPAFRLVARQRQEGFCGLIRTAITQHFGPAMPVSPCSQWNPLLGAAPIACDRNSGKKPDTNFCLFSKKVAGPDRQTEVLSGHMLEPTRWSDSNRCWFWRKYAGVPDAAQRPIDVLQLPQTAGRLRIMVVPSRGGSVAGAGLRGPGPTTLRSSRR
jgi:hypothetical protein